MPTIVDVLLPTYNPGAEHLKIALNALVAQTYPHWEAFIHDESDKVDVRAIVRPYLSDPRFRFARADKRLGIGGNWNACLTHTRNPFVAYLFHDDEWHPEYLARAVEILEKNPDVGLVSMEHSYRIEEESDEAVGYRNLERKKKEILKPGSINGREFLLTWVRDGIWPNLIGEPSFCVLRRSVMDRIGPWNEDMPQSLDAEYWVRMLEVTDWYYQPENSGFFRVHAEGTTAKNRREGRGLFDRFRILQDLIDRLPRGPERSAALHAQVGQFETMLRKYFAKRERGDRITYGGSGIVKKFALRHPFVVLRACFRVLLHRGKAQ